MSLLQQIEDSENALYQIQKKLRKIIEDVSDEFFICSQFHIGRGVFSVFKSGASDEVVLFLNVDGLFAPLNPDHCANQYQELDIDSKEHDEFIKKVNSRLKEYKGEI